MLTSLYIAAVLTCDLAVLLVGIHQANGPSLVDESLNAPSEGQHVMLSLLKRPM